MQYTLKNVLYVTLGFLSFTLGVIGVVTPILPTTPFILLAAWCFARGSPKLHAKLLSNKHFGPMIVDWTEHGRIRKSVKVRAILLLVLGISISIYLVKLLLLQVMLICIGLGVSLFIATRRG